MAQGCTELSTIKHIDILGKPVVVGVARGSNSDPAVRVAMDLAARFDLDAEFVHGEEQERGMLLQSATAREAALTTRRLKKTHDRIAAHLDTLAYQGSDLALATKLQVLPGHPAEVLIERARGSDAGLIVLGSHRRLGLGDLGSTIHAVLMSAPCAVWLQNEQPQTIQRVVAPVNCSPASRHSLAVAIGLARRFNVSLTVLHSFEPPEFTYPPRPGGGMSTYVVDDMRQAERDAFEVLLSSIDWERVEHNFLFVEDLPASAILTEQQPGDLVVMATQGKTGFLAAMLGGVTRAVLRKTHGPVVAVRLPDRNSENE